MTAIEFRAIRLGLGLKQIELARVLGNTANYVARMEASGPHARAIPHHVIMLMQAYQAGYRPANWPTKEH